MGIGPICAVVEKWKKRRNTRVFFTGRFFSTEFFFQWKIPSLVWSASQNGESFIRLSLVSCQVMILSVGWMNGILNSGCTRIFDAPPLQKVKLNAGMLGIMR